MQVHEHELYYQLCEAFRANVKEMDGGLGVPMHALTELVKDTDPRLTGNAAGRIAREFLQTVSGCTPTISSARVGGRSYMLYKLSGVKLGQISVENGD